MYQAIVFFPLLGALIAGLLGSVIGPRRREYVTSRLAGCLRRCCPGSRSSPSASARARPSTVPVLRWIHSGALDAAGCSASTR